MILAGAGVAAAIAAFWLGGAAVALGLAATPWFHRPESAQRVADPDEVARALRAWEEERLGAGGADVELRRISGGAPTR